MAREYAKIRTDIWGDEDWRDVSGGEKLLYFTLLSHATLSYAGVADWRPKKLAPLLDQLWKPAYVADLATSLESRNLIVVDDESEEVLVRSFIKHDGIMKQPRLAVSMASAFSAVASLRLRQVIAHEVQKLRDDDPELACWSDPRVRTVLDHSPLNVKEFGQGLGKGLGSVSEAFGPNVGQGLVSPTTTATTTNKERSAAKRGSRVPEPFNITEDMREWAKIEAPLVDLDKKLGEWVDYWKSVPGQKGVKLDWASTWRNGMRKQQDFALRDRGPVQPKKRQIR